MLVLFNGPLTNAFQPSLPTEITNGCATFNFHVVVANVAVPGTPAVVQWYAETTAADPNATATEWYREVSTADKNNGDLQMAIAIRRFTNNADATDLHEGTYSISVPLRDLGSGFCRIQICVAALGADACTARISDPFGRQLQSAP